MMQTESHIWNQTDTQVVYRVYMWFMSDSIKHKYQGLSKFVVILMQIMAHFKVKRKLKNSKKHMLLDIWY